MVSLKSRAFDGIDIDFDDQKIQFLKTNVGGTSFP